MMNAIPEGRPKLKIEPGPLDWILEILGWAGVVFLCAYAAYQHRALPETIPTHFGISGKPDVYGGKAMILFLPITGIVLFAGMTVLNRYPHVFNYPIRITAENAAIMYATSMRLVRYLRLAVVVVFSLILYFSVRTAHGKAPGIGPWFLPLFIVLITLPLLVSIFRMLNNKRQL